MTKRNRYGKTTKPDGSPLYEMSEEDRVKLYAWRDKWSDIEYKMKTFTTLKLVRRPGKFVSNQALDVMMFKYDLKWNIKPTAIRTDLVVEVTGSQENIDDLVETTLWEKV